MVRVKGGEKDSDRPFGYLLFHPFEGAIVGFQEAEHVFEDSDGGAYEEAVLCQRASLRLLYGWM